MMGRRGVDESKQIKKGKMTKREKCQNRKYGNPGRREGATIEPEKCRVGKKVK
jgi:hypothetical protein